MRILRIVGNALLWVFAVVGVLSGALWVANSLGYVQPLVVVSGSMEPQIRTGDLIVDVPRTVEELQVGDVASIRSAHTGNLVTHRVIELIPGDGHVEVRMQGDANEVPDAEAYVVAAGDSVLTPVLTVQGGGFFVEKVAQPGVALPLLVSIAALIVLAVLPSRLEDDADASAREPVR